MPFNSRQQVHGGGKFKSEAQRRAMWANAPAAAKAWADNRTTRRSDWAGMSRTRSAPMSGRPRVSVGRTMARKASPRSMPSGRHRSMSMKRSGGRGRVR